jgi:hypothetical protein
MANQIQLSGNPFVDTGYYVLAALGRVSRPEDLTWEDVRRIYGNGLELAHANVRLKGFTMVFGTNGPLTQSGYRPKGNKKVLSDTNVAAYAGVLSAFLHEVEHDAPEQPLCEICGISHTFNFSDVIGDALGHAGIKDPGAKQIGRDWFPLAGSPGNDVQALPAASRGLHICAKCLFAVHYMPLGLMLVQGKLACFQSTPIRIAVEMTGDTVEQYQSFLAASSGKVELLGKKKGTTQITTQMLAWMRKRRDVMRDGRLEEAHFTVWLFTNSGTNADCDLLQIPNDAMQFLWRVYREGLDSELENLLRDESKRADEQLLMRVLDRRDYARLYPYKTFEGASPRLFALYHQAVLGETANCLQLAQNLANDRIHTADAKERKVLRKPRVLEGTDGKRERSLVKRTMLNLAQSSGFDLDAYQSLFPVTQLTPLKVDWRGWRTLGYYMYQNTDEPVTDYSGYVTTAVPQQPEMKGGQAMKPRKDIKQIAQMYFDHWIGPDGKGIARFDREIFRGWNKNHGRDQGIAWLRQVFVELALKSPGFEIEDWDLFVQDEEGHPWPMELVFQMRLALANIYREYVSQTKPVTGENR